MEPRTAASQQPPDPDAVAFVRFCYHRRRVGWPELYDEMCAVAARGLYRGYGSDDLAGIGIAFGLFEMPALASLATRIVDEERASRRPVTVVITDSVEVEAPVPVAVVVADPVESDVEAHALPIAQPATSRSIEAPARPEPAIRFVPVPAGA
jgi:hypothetical protein